MKLKKKVNEVFKEISLWKDVWNIFVGVLSNNNKHTELLNWIKVINGTLRLLTRLVRNRVTKE